MPNPTLSENEQGPIGALLAPLKAVAPHALDDPTVLWKAWAFEGPDQGAWCVPPGATVAVTGSYGLLAYLARQANGREWKPETSARWTEVLESISEGHLRHETQESQQALRDGLPSSPFARSRPRF